MSLVAAHSNRFRINTGVMNDAALVLFSAGQDSAVCLAWALKRFARVETIGFAYGQRHAVELEQRGVLRREMRAVGASRRWGELGEDIVVDLSGYGALAESALTADRAIEMAANGLPTTFVPGRNLVFFSVAAAQAYRRGIGVLVGGMCETDYSGYPDCRRETLDAMQQALSLGLAAPMRIETPLMHLTKAQTWALAHELGGDDLVERIVEHSHTCYQGDRSRRHDWGYGCGACPACDLRVKGWAGWTSGVLARRDGPR
jgi:7-cyano-7-deazaguanine synthase